MTEEELHIAKAKHLEIKLYELLSEIAYHNGMDGGTESMATMALVVATDLFKKCGIYGFQFAKRALIAMSFVEKFNQQYVTTLSENNKEKNAK